MSKKELVRKIKDLLTQLGIEKACSVGIYWLDDIEWVSYSQVLRKRRLPNYNNGYQLYREKLYSKDVNIDELWQIHNELKQRLENGQKL